MASAAMVVITGKIITASTRDAANTENPKGMGKIFRRKGTSTVRPTQP